MRTQIHSSTREKSIPNLFCNVRKRIVRLHENDKGRDKDSNFKWSFNHQVQENDATKQQSLDVPFKDTMIKHRQLFLSKDLLCNPAKGGVVGFVAVLVSLLTFGLVKMPGGGTGKGKGKGDRKLSRTQQRTYSLQDFKKLQDSEYIRNLSESEAQEIITGILKELEWNEKNVPELHGRKLFNILELLGLLECSECPCGPPTCGSFGEGFLYTTFQCIGDECVSDEEVCANDCDVLLGCLE